jgi:hypothetical protein
MRRPARINRATSPPISATNRQELSEIHIGLDPGQENSKCSYMLKPLSKASVLRQEEDLSQAVIDNVVWPNSNTSLTTRVAILPGRIVCGNDVDKAFEDGSISTSDVLDCLKSAVLTCESNPQLDAKLKSAISPVTAFNLEKCLQEYGKDYDDCKLYRATLYSMYLGYLYRQVLHFIADNHGSLEWTVFDDLDQYRHYQLPGKPKVYVSIALPVTSTSEQVQLILAMAKAADIPNPYPVAEPSAHCCDM